MIHNLYLITSANVPACSIDIVKPRTCSVSRKQTRAAPQNAILGLFVFCDPSAA